tara:strand:- start:24 stop:470 length:447 start_codon:yes stop_codon:yes gene_type:complete
VDSEKVNFFVGEYRHSVDEKGRLTIPSKWRIKGDDSAYLGIPNPEGYVTVLPPARAALLYETLSKAALSDHGAQQLLMQLGSQSHSFGCDKQGRINLNDKLLKHAGIKGKAALVGNFTTFSVWSEERYVKREAPTDRTILDAMRDLGL